jgi:hypothetical protein
MKNQTKKDPITGVLLLPMSTVLHNSLQMNKAKQSNKGQVRAKCSPRKNNRQVERTDKKDRRNKHTKTKASRRAKRKGYRSTKKLQTHRPNAHSRLTEVESDGVAKHTLAHINTYTHTHEVEFEQRPKLWV